MTEEYTPPRGRPPKPVHRVQHGTDQGYLWHSRQRRIDPSHQSCPECKRAWRERQAAYRRGIDHKRTIIGQVIVRGREADALKDLAPSTIKDLERLLAKFATPEEKRELYD